MCFVMNLSYSLINLKFCSLQEVISFWDLLMYVSDYYYSKANNINVTYEESTHPLGNEFSRALESRFLVPKNEVESFWDLLTYIPIF